MCISDWSSDVCSSDLTPFPMSIYDNIAFGIRLYEKVSKADMNDRVEDALKRTALWDEVKDKLQDSGLGMSGGQQQRLCIARSIAVRSEERRVGKACVRTGKSRWWQ